MKANLEPFLGVMHIWHVKFNFSVSWIMIKSAGDLHTIGLPYLDNFICLENSVDWKLALKGLCQVTVNKPVMSILDTCLFSCPHIFLGVVWIHHEISSAISVILEHYIMICLFSVKFKNPFYKISLLFWKSSGKLFVMTYQNHRELQFYLTLLSRVPKTF